MFPFHTRHPRLDGERGERGERGTRALGILLRTYRILMMDFLNNLKLIF